MFMLGNTLTVEQRVQKSAVAIMAHQKWADIGGVLMVGERTVCDKAPTAYTNGKDVVFGRAFVSKLSDAELRFLDLHEQMHKAYRHLVTWKHLHEKDAQLANVAMDMVINVDLVDHDGGEGFIVMPEGGCLDLKYRKWDTAQVFKDLQDNGLSGDDFGGFDEHDFDGATEMTAEQAKELARDIDEALRQGLLLGGKTGSGGDKLLGDLLEPQVDWREVLREFVQTTCSGSDYSTWKRPNRRYVSSGYYMPSGISEQIGEIVVAIDTSGSIGQRELASFLSEVKAIADTVHPEAVRVLYWDTEVCGDERYEAHELDNLVKTTKPQGGGGTMIECVPAYITKHDIKAQAVIVLTDGYLGGSCGVWNNPVLWCVLDNKSATPSVGTTVHIKGRDM